MPSQISTDEIEKTIYDIAVECELRTGATFPVHMVYNKVSAQAKNDVQNVLQSLKNRHLLTVQEKVTDGFFEYFESELETA